MKVVSYRYYLVIVLAIIFAFNLTDLWAMGMSLQSIKRDLHLSDTELGFVSGFAFFFFYSAFGLPMGRWADRGNRVAILSATRILWSTFVILTGRVTTFAQLLIARMGAGVGEAGCLPPAYSLISDHFSRAERPQAIGLFFMSAPLSTLLGYMGVGWVLEYYGWHSVFTVIGLSGFVLAPIAWLTLKEPRKERANETSRPLAPPIWTALRYLGSNGTYRNLTAAIVVNYLFGGGVFQWLPAYFMRSFGLQSGVLGMWLALVIGLPGMIGNYVGGRVAARRAGGNERLQLVTVAALNCSLSVLMPLVYFSHSYVAAFGLLGLWTMAGALSNPPILSALQLVVPSRVCGTSIMLAFFFANLIGSGLGPIAIGALSDLLRPMFGGDSLRYALLVITPCYFWGGWHLWRASRSVTRDISAREALEVRELGRAVTPGLVAPGR